MMCLELEVSASLLPMTSCSQARSVYSGAEKLKEENNLPLHHFYMNPQFFFRLPPCSQFTALSDKVLSQKHNVSRVPHSDLRCSDQEVA